MKTLDDIDKKLDGIYGTLAFIAFLLFLLCIGSCAHASDGPWSADNNPSYLIDSIQASTTTFTPTQKIYFSDGKKDVGEISWGTGKFVFTGKADKSARIFFYEYLKPLVDRYMESNEGYRKCVERTICTEAAQ